MTSHTTIHLKDYRPPAFAIPSVHLHVAIHGDHAVVTSTLELQRRQPGSGEPLVLMGQELELVAISMDGRTLAASEYALTSETLTIAAVPDAFRLTVVSRIHPEKNTALEGLYRSGAMFCTQCEAEGFRRITWFLDRPDVLARYTTRIEADKARCPILLANGNCIASGDLADGRHYAVWEDPFPKPSYLFAMVAGDLVRISDTFTTMSGRKVALEIYVEHHNRDKCDHAMASLKRAMRWEEETFGLEYDLGQYMIVATDDFNMGAMENKGLNIFNSKYVLARPDTATDDDFEAIEAVIAHEYLHNWTGNRVTCRDWFQLSLKEGLTVFRDQLFSEATISLGVKRVHDVQTLRNHQFPEDSGPMAHPVRPDAYIEINNFYTVTVYEKGAELIRMLYTLLGRERFRAGLRLYLSRHDGTAATVEDFVAAMAEAGDRDFAQFLRWYTQAGTPTVRVATAYDEASQRYSLALTQSCPPTPGQPEKEPLHIPVAVGLLDAQGRAMPLQLAGNGAEKANGSVLLELRAAEETFVFESVASLPIPSLLRGFSAPVKLDYEYSDGELAVLLAHDSDPFNRWEAGQRLACRVLLALVAHQQAGQPLTLAHDFVDSMAAVLADTTLADQTFVAQLCTLPTEEYLGEQLAVVDVEAIHAAREFVRRELAIRLRPAWEKLRQANRDPGPYRYDPHLAGRRRLKNLALGYLMTLDESAIRQQCLAQFTEADNMSDAGHALRLLVHAGAPEAQPALAAFAERWQAEPLVMDKWFTIQATAPLPGTLDAVRHLMAHPAFKLTNPNRVRALIGAFAMNPLCFHAPGGEGYHFLADQILALDPMNPQIAARLATRLSRWRRYDHSRQALMRAELERLMAASLSRDLYEVVQKSLA
ncbi:MAG: aminopeptidase N [Thermodesulfobacteriota bacterium]